MGANHCVWLIIACKQMRFTIRTLDILDIQLYNYYNKKLYLKSCERKK